MPGALGTAAASFPGVHAGRHTRTILLALGPIADVVVELVGSDVHAAVSVEPDVDGIEEVELLAKPAKPEDPVPDLGWHRGGLCEAPCCGGCPRDQHSAVLCAESGEQDVPAPAVFPAPQAAAEPGGTPCRRVGLGGIEDAHQLGDRLLLRSVGLE